MRSRESILRRAINLGGEHSRLKMDLLQEWFEPSEELQSTGLFCHDVPEHLPTLGKCHFRSQIAFFT